MKYPEITIENNSVSSDLPTEINTDKKVTDNTIGVLFMAYGGPESIDEMAGYLADIRSGRVTSKEVLEEISANYEAIGGKSPLSKFTKSQIEETMKLLDQKDDFKAYAGMRHWSPWIEDAVKNMLEDGIKKAIAIVLAPHYSKMSIQKYQEKIKAALNMLHDDLEIVFVNEYHTEENYIKAMSNRVKMGLEQFEEKDRGDVHVIFSAHSLPVRIINEGDPYADQLLESARLIATEAELKEENWSFCFQSAGKSPEPWLDPQLEDYLVFLKEKKNIDKVISIAIGFVSDHVEILFDIDIEAQKVAKENGIKLIRPPALNSDPLFMQTLANIIYQKSKELN